MNRVQIVEESIQKIQISDRSEAVSWGIPYANRYGVSLLSLSSSSMTTSTIAARVWRYPIFA